MKQTVKTKELKRILQLAAKVVKRSAVLPVLECVKFENGHIIGSDLERSIKVPLAFDGPPILIELSVLREVVRKSKAVSLQLESTGEALKVSAPDGSFEVSLQSDGPVDDYPVTPFELVREGDEKATAIVEADIYFPAKVTEAVVVAANYQSNESLRPIMCGVLLDHETVVSTDAHRLYKKTFNYGIRPFNVNGSEGDFGGILLTEKLTDIMKLVGGGFRLTYNKFNLVVTMEEGGVVFLQRITEGRYPQYNAVIPAKDNCPKQLIVATDILDRLLQQSEFAQNKTTHQVQFCLNQDKQTVTVSTQDLDFNRQFSKTVSAEVKLPDSVANEVGEVTFDIAVNGKFMREILANCGDVATLRFSTANRAILVNDEFLAMPVLLNV